MSPEQRLVVVSYRLPFHVENGSLVQNSGGLVSAMLAYANGSGTEQGAAKRSILWIGASDDSSEDFAKATRTEEQSAFELIPVSIDAETNKRFYEGFSNNLLWPLFHYFPYLCRFDAGNFESYRNVNRMFMEVVQKLLRPGDRLWIHDYHFLLLPRLVRERHPHASIGFFLHIPFPSYELLRLMPRAWRKEIVQGILGADLAGFHTYDYVQHFTQSAIRVVGAQSMGSWLATEDGATRIEAFPIGIDAKYFASLRDLPDTRIAYSRIREAIGDRLLVFSVDRLDYSKGLLQRLLAFEKFLTLYPQWRERIVFNMVVVPSRDVIQQYQEMKTEIETHVGRINGLMATLEWRPVVYQYRHLDRHELVALYDAADIGLITPMRDGMNLVSKEFVACQPPVSPGILILSEMAGAAAELREALLINPNDMDEMVEALHRAAEMGDEERLRIWDKLRDRVFSYDVFEWASDYLQSLDNAVQTLRGPRSTPLLVPEIENLRAQYLLAGERLLLLDYDGTLVPFHRDPEKAVPGPHLHDLLIKLSQDPRNQIAIVSGRSKTFLDRWFGDLPLVLVAEHGAWVRKPGKDWQDAWNGDRNWKVAFLRVLKRAARRCPGSMVEEKETALVWHYRNADPLHGARVAQELREDLDTILQATPGFKLVEGHLIVEIRPDTVDKGSATLQLFGPLNQSFILAVGDDRTDEDLFAIVPPQGYAIKVGKGSTRARYSLPDPTDVFHLLDSLQKTGSSHWPE